MYNYSVANDFSSGIMIFVMIIYFVFILAILAGFAVLCIFLCKKVAVQRGLDTKYMWFGLLGLNGLLIVALVEPKIIYAAVPDMRNRISNTGRYCSQCGHTNNINNHYCNGCGKAL